MGAYNLSLAGSANYVMWFGLSENHPPQLLARLKICWHSLLISLRISNHDPGLWTREPTPRFITHRSAWCNLNMSMDRAYHDAIRSWAQAVTRRPISVFRTDLSTD